VAASVIIVAVAVGSCLGAVIEPAAGGLAVGVLAGGDREAVGSFMIHRSGATGHLR